MCFASRLIQDSLVNESRDQLAFSPVHITENSHEEAMIFGTIFCEVLTQQEKYI